MYYYRYSSAGFAGFVGKQNTRTNVHVRRKTNKGGCTTIGTSYSPAGFAGFGTEHQNTVHVRRTNKAGRVLISTNVPIVDKAGRVLISTNVPMARMPMSRAPRQLLTSWVAHSRPVGCPQMTWGRTLENALASKGISKEFKEWIAIAKDRPKWRQQTHSKPRPPDA